MLPFHEKVTALEEGFFGFANVKLGANAKENGILLRNVHRFRRATLSVLILLGLALGYVCIYRQRAARARTELAASTLRQRATECRAIVEGILLKQDEVDELCRRLRQREVLDTFLTTERAFEIELKERISKIARGGPENATRQVQLEMALDAEMKWFADSLGDAVEQIVAPLDKAFHDIPVRIKAVQADIHAELPAFETRPTPTNASGGICTDLPSAVSGAPWKHSFAMRIERLVEIARNASSASLNQTTLANWAKARGEQKQTDEVMQIPAALVAMLLRWYTGTDPAKIMQLLVPMVQTNESFSTPEPEDDDDDGGDDNNEDQNDEDENDDDDDDDKKEEDDDD